MRSGKHACTTCGKTYKHKHHLKRHHDFECGVAPKFSCEFCPHKTRYKESLMKHILARHQGLWEQYTSQNEDASHYGDNGNSHAYEAAEEFEATIQISEDAVYETYSDFSQNM